MKNFQKLGGFSALYLAMAYLVGIVLFLFVLDYPNIVEPSQKIDLLVNHQTLIYITNLLMYVFFGVFLAVLVLALHDRLKNNAPSTMQIATAIGIIWAGVLIASGMISNSGIAPAVMLYQNDPTQAASFWLGIESVAKGLGGANGEILGGLFTLLVSLAAFHGGLLPKGLNCLGIFVGAVGIISTCSGLKDLAGLFGLGQIVWFVCLGIFFLLSGSILPKKSNL